MSNSTAEDTIQVREIVGKAAETAAIWGILYAESAEQRAIRAGIKERQPGYTSSNKGNNWGFYVMLGLTGVCGASVANSIITKDPSLIPVQTSLFAKQVAVNIGAFVATPWAIFNGGMATFGLYNDTRVALKKIGDIEVRKPHPVRWLKNKLQTHNNG
ncbi:MAG: hypothetical protein PHE27_04205 [Alphaproteobacteria bacterium]|nr:hypothetical protein [Alphaproteobacteria bacterium]